MLLRVPFFGRLSLICVGTKKLATLAFKIGSPSLPAVPILPRKHHPKFVRYLIGFNNILGYDAFRKKGHEKGIPNLLEAQTADFERCLRWTGLRFKSHSLTGIVKPAVLPYTSKTDWNSRACVQTLENITGLRAGPPNFRQREAYKGNGLENDKR